jgi:transglutaminase-like putative cysteine protease
MDRRDFLRTAGVVSAGLAFPQTRRAFAQSATNSGWRTFEVVTRVEVLKPSGVTRVWVPGALTSDTPYQRTTTTVYKSDGGKVNTTEIKTDGLKMVMAEFPAGVRPVLTVTSQVATRNWAVELSSNNNSMKASRAELEHYLRATKLLPTDGIVKDKAMEITKGAKTDVDKARAIYEWIVSNCYRNPTTQGCGLGDIRYMLEANDLGGKCADINALYVGLARAAGVPARDVYGIRIAKSDLGYKSLGTSSDVISKSQHCRAEVYLSDHGWVPVDPADVRKVMLEEPPGNRPVDDDMVKRARARLFGSWEMNWMAYNFAHDVELPGSSGKAVGFLMYPQAETSDGRLNSLDPDSFKYTITSREATA